MDTVHANQQQSQKSVTPNNLIQAQVPLHDKNWFKTGGPAQWYSEPTTAAEFQEAILWAHTHNLTITLLGEGANVLISDAGITGLVIRPKLMQISHELSVTEDMLVTAGAGVSMYELIDYCLQHNIIGLEEFSGIPGTVGGSVFINIHYFEFLLSSFITQAVVIDAATGELQTVDTAWFNFGYNQSTLHTGSHYLVSLTCKLRSVSDLETAYHKGRRAEIIRHRANRYPKSGTCGSFFRNFYPTEVAAARSESKVIYVAYYLDKIGVKGTLSCGDAIVSYQHANMLVNRGTATTADLVELAQTMQKLVYDNFGIMPQTECRLLGFDKHPLL